MKTRGVLLILSVLLFSSCIVKSLQPFYIKSSLKFNKDLLGEWTDHKEGQWTVESFQKKFEEDKKEGEKLSEDGKLVYDTYKDGYLVTYIKNEKEAVFIAMPFKIENQYFLDFIPINIEDEEINSLAAEHLLKTHSVAKLDFTTDKNVMFSWLSEERIKDIFEENKIRLKHESIGPEQTLLLTATSEELYRFLKKYLNADIENKWKESDQIALTRANAKP